MWKDPDPDPGGDPQKGVSTGQSSQELSDLKDQNEQQKLLIAQLKEMLRKEQSNVTQEKVEEYVNTLSKIKAKKTRVRKEESGSSEKSVSSSSIDNKNKGKISLLKQQLEENKAKLAERGKNQKGIEEMVSQLKAQFNDSQQLINYPLNISEPKNVEYSKNSSQEELYNILLTKEKRITDLISKNQSQEASILDLQENLKEKDSVIDARTKAITLMTENLSKKGKSTLDELDDTREQMRKMQENFVTLESEMKARQIKLLNDLKAKNFEIAELQDNNQKLSEEKVNCLKIIDEYKSRESNNESETIIKNLQQQLEEKLSENEANLLKISDLEKRLQDSIEDFNRLKNTGISSVSTTEATDNEIAKLKKQLEESNKNMIKVKAQNKSKIKELTKKIDAFKKVSDANALILQLQAENTKLSEKIAELEEEKGNLQLKMVESTDSTKDSTHLEENKELEETVSKQIEELEEKDKIISLLESDIIALKDEIKGLNENISGFTHLENVQVTSEIKSIQIEEQLEKVESENLQLKKEIQDRVKEKEELLEKMEELKKEKQEISAKLDSYIQENMELIDKLEKLSAEKVSSAESIEIVEGLTQQEKLELAAYQKNIDVHMEEEPIKCTEEDNIEPPPELNESVLQLSEDSTELLQKIDMFNMERKEVMGRMETLREENNQLNLKIKEIENNRDILAETYEQLQNEKEILQRENEELGNKLRLLEEEMGHSEKVEYEHDDSLSAKLRELQNNYEKLLSEHEELKRTLKDYDTQIHEKHNWETEISNARLKIDDLEAKLKSNMEEITNYQSVIEENKNELINSAKLINNLQNRLAERENDIKELNVMINDLNTVVNSLQIENSKLGNFEFMEAQVDELKTALNEQINQAQEYEEEIARNNDIINDLNSKFVEMNRKILETEHETEMKDIEVKNLAQLLEDKEETIKNLQTQVQEKDKKVHAVIDDMKQKYLGLQSRLEGNSGELESRVAELTNKNKEQLEKMKKIAANLKKKTQAYQELEERYNEEKEKWETEVNEKTTMIVHSKDKMDNILQQLKELENELNLKSAKLEQSEHKVRELTEVVQNLEQTNSELQNLVMEYKHKEEKLTEVSLKQELSTSLHEDFDDMHGNQSSANEDKIKELELIIETNESELVRYKERVDKLEQTIAHLEGEKESLEKKALDFEEKLNVTTKNIEEKSLLEEELGMKLAQVTANDEELVKKIEELSEENRELSQKNKESDELTQKLKIKLKKAHEKVTQLKSLQLNMEELENTNNELKKQVTNLEVNQKHIQDENEALQKQNQNDYERIEADYQVQLEELVRIKNELTVECEKLQETVKDLQGREEELLSEVAELKQKLEQNETLHKEQVEQLSDDLRVATFNWNESSKEIDVLKQQNEKLEKELVVFVAKETVENVITEATDKVININTVACQTDILQGNIENVEQVNVVQSAELKPETVPTFHWPGNQEQPHVEELFSQQQNPQTSILFTDNNLQDNPQVDWFNSAYVVPDSAPLPDQPLNPFYSQQPLVVENTKEELLNKIKALEFLLYNVDKEKEEALRECTRMVNELTRLVYEKVNTPNPEIVPSKPAPNPLSLVESQIVSDVDVADAAANKEQLQRIEFEKTDVFLEPQSFPVVEDVIQPKRAYLTYKPSDEKIPTGIEAFGENDDGWGWGPEEAKLEEEHLTRAENTPQIQNLRSEIAQLNERLQVYQVERENHLEEIRQLQIKSGKLIKKCKELKLMNDQLKSKQHSKGDGADFFDLDETIQEEFKTQIAQLEKKLKELTAELEKEKHEKSNILKRVDVLTSANERMVEMKEIQDTEVLHWKRKCQETEEKLQQYEWGSDGFTEGRKLKESAENIPSTSCVDNSKIEELQQTIKELSLDNEELQALLEEQRQLRMNAEKEKNVPEHTRLEEEYSKLLSDSESKVKNLEQEILNKHEEINAIMHKNKKIELENGELQRIIKEQETNIAAVQEDLRVTTAKKAELDQILSNRDNIFEESLVNEKNAVIQEQRERIAELEKDLIYLQDNSIQRETIFKEREKAYDELRILLDQRNLRLDELTDQVGELNKELEEYRQKYDKEHTNSETNILDLLRELEQEKEQRYKLEAEMVAKNEEYNDALKKQHWLSEDLQAEKIKVRDLSNDFEQQMIQMNHICSENVAKITELEQTVQQLQSVQQELEQQKLEKEKICFENAAKISELEQTLQQLQNIQSEFDKQKLETDHVSAENLAKISELAQTVQQLQSIKIELEQEILQKDQICSENAAKISELELTMQQLQSRQSKSIGGGSEVVQQNQLLERLLAEKDTIISQLQESVLGFENNKKLFEDELRKLTQNLEAAEKENEQLQKETEESISRLAAELEERWMAQVDQRGADVAESWKLHLESVQADFTAVQEKLKYEINELEEKCNALVNENNELRKNVDAEIRNEVDRISALQQQINDRQQFITELNGKLLEKQKENEASIEKLSVLEKDNEQLKKEIVDRDNKLGGLNIIIETTQQQFDEKREVVEEIVRILEKNTSWPLSYEKQEVLNEFQRQLNVITEKEQEILTLSQLIDNLQNQLSVVPEKDKEINNLNQLLENLQAQVLSVDEKDKEIANWRQLVEDLQKQISLTQERDSEIFHLNEMIRSLQEQHVLNQAKDGEVVRLNQVIEDLQIQLNLLQDKEGEIIQLNEIIENYKVQHEMHQQELALFRQEKENANLSFEDYKQKLEDFRNIHIELQNTLEEKNQLIVTLKQQLQFTENLKNDNNKEVEMLQAEISQAKQDCSILQQSLSDCQQELFTVTNTLSTKTNELENVTQQLAYSQQNFETLEAELTKLRDTLQEREQEYTNSVENLRRTQLRELENHYEEVLAAKDLDIHSIRTQLQESINYSHRLNETLNNELSLRQQLEEKVRQLDEKIAEQSVLLDEENKQLSEMRGIIEQQVIKIEDLKKELFEKSNDYDSLIAEMDISRKAITQQPTASANLTENPIPTKSSRIPEDDLAEPVSRAELDLALYMLHQRDVRCEELTVELTQLLEERDTLQLRLSNAIRENEEIRRRLAGPEEVTSMSSSPKLTTTPSKSSAIFLAASGTELGMEPLDTSISSVDELQNKLSQLKSVGYKKDKTFVDEQDRRRLQQMSIMQQHINEASKLPPEAAAKLVDATYTLSRDVQSPSKVLLNWLWGRSTPKVNDT